MLAPTVPHSPCLSPPPPSSSSPQHIHSLCLKCWPFSGFSTLWALFKSSFPVLFAGAFIAIPVPQIPPWISILKSRGIYLIPYSYTHRHSKHGEAQNGTENLKLLLLYIWYTSFLEQCYVYWIIEKVLVCSLLSISWVNTILQLMVQFYNWWSIIYPLLLTKVHSLLSLLYVLWVLINDSYLPLW